jgi:uncharacterized protein (TIGR00369 family)
MPKFEPRNPDFRAASNAVFEQQPAMRTLGISIARLAPGEADLAMPYDEAFSQQHGYLHAGIVTAGLDNACGIAAHTLMAAGAGILTVEFKTNLLAPADGARFVFRGRVIKPGRTITVCDGHAFAERNGAEFLVATMTATLMALLPASA